MSKFNYKVSKKIRPYSELSSVELEHQLAAQLKTPLEAHPLEVTAFGDANRSWLLPDRLYGASHVVTSNAAAPTGDIIYSTNTFDMGEGVKYTLEQAYLKKEDGSVKAVGPTKVREALTSNGRESDLDWLRRRVAEVLWVPM